MALSAEIYNFGFDTVDANCMADREAMALDYTAPDGRRLGITRDYFRHHSDLMAEFLRFKGVKPRDYAVVCGLEDTFELYLLLTALSKIEAVVVVVAAETLADALRRYCPTLVVCDAQSRAVDIVNQQDDSTLKLRVSIGVPTPKGWRDLHRGSWRVHEFLVPDFGERTDQDIVAVDYLTDNQVVYTRHSLTQIEASEGWKGFVTSQLKGHPFIVNKQR